MSKIILPDDVKQAQSIFQQQAAEEEMQQEMMAGLVQMVTNNVIANLVNSPMGIAYLDDNGEHCSKEKSRGFEPEKKNDRDSGYDLKSPEDFVLKAGEQQTVGLKIAALMPSYLDMFILPRSGHANKNGITITNSPGLIDSSYLYEIKIILLNTSQNDWRVKRGDRIAQARVQLKGCNLMIKEFDGDLKDLQDKVMRKGGLGSTNEKS